MRSPSVARVGATVAVVVALVFGGAVGVAIGAHQSKRSGTGTGSDTTTDVGGTTTSFDASEPVSFLFALRAASMTAAPSGSSGASTLVLAGVDAQGEWFTDRPARRSGVEDLSRLLPMFFGPDAGAPPNATVAGVSGGRGFLAAVELSGPRWDASTRVLTIVATPLSDRATGVIPATATDVVVTVDATARTCQVNIAPIDMPAYGSLYAVSTSVQQGSGLLTGSFVASSHGAFEGPMNVRLEDWLKEYEPQSSGGIWFYGYGTSAQGCAATLQLTIASMEWEVPYTIRWANPGDGPSSISIETEADDWGTTITVDPSSTPDGQFAQWNLDVSVVR